MIVVAGHLCLDVFPTMSSQSELRPGRLIEVGTAHFSTGGTVSNVGLALHKLGAKVKLVGKIGDDAFGRIVQDLFKEVAPELASGLVITPTGETSYSVVISPPGQDRIFLHAPGCNDTFGIDDLDFASIREAKLFHFGYPPLMARMYGDGGVELAGIMNQARSAGMTTSLDMSLPDPSTASGQANWRLILERVLPHVDYFLPSRDELSFMLGTSNVDEFFDLCDRFGVGQLIIKDGERGLITRSEGTLIREYCYDVETVGTTGAGDTTIAGFLYGLLQGWELRKCLRAATAVGACCVEAADATSGILSWLEVEKRLAKGWGKVEA
jgi:sugar/nucleoside kinase (ribokinase family)